MLELALPQEIEDRLEVLARNAGHTKASFAEEVLIEHVSGESDSIPPKHLAAFREKWSEAIADTSDGLDPEPVFDHLEQKYQSLSEGQPH